jgi:hypothetical protein
MHNLSSVGHIFKDISSIALEVETWLTFNGFINIKYCNRPVLCGWRLNFYYFVAHLRISVRFFFFDEISVRSLVFVLFGLVHGVP